MKTVLTMCVLGAFLTTTALALDDPKHSLAEKRNAVFGVTDGGRWLVVVYTMRGPNIRVISARDMNRKERKYYEDEGKR